MSPSSWSPCMGSIGGHEGSQIPQRRFGQFQSQGPVRGTMAQGVVSARVSRGISSSWKHARTGKQGTLTSMHTGLISTAAANSIQKTRTGSSYPEVSETGPGETIRSSYLL